MANAQPIPVEHLRNEYYQDNWHWDPSTKCEDVLLSDTQKAAYFHTNPILESRGTAGVRGTKGFIDGEHYWEVTFLEPPCGTSVMVGVGTRQAQLKVDDYKFVDLLGKDEHSWGLSYKGKAYHKAQSTSFCEPFYDQSTVIGVHLNLYTGTLSFYKDGQCLGVAFKGLNAVGEELFPMICSTAMYTELEVGIQTCRYLSLQEKCFLCVAQNVKEKENIHLLPLPPFIKRHLLELK